MDSRERSASLPTMWITFAEALLSAARTTPMSGVRIAEVHGFHCEAVMRARGLRDRADRVANVLTAWQIVWDGDRPV